LNIEGYIKIRIKKARIILSGLDENAQEEILFSDINDIRTKLLEILDYTISHFPGYKGNAKLYFPLLSPESCSVLDKDRRFVNIKKELGLVGAGFVEDAQFPIQKNNGALLLLSGSIKHRNKDRLQENGKVAIEGTYQTFGDGPKVSQDMHGNLRIGDGFIFGGENNVFQNCTFSDGKGATVLNLVTKRVQGRTLLVEKDKKEYEVYIYQWLDSMIQTVEGIYELWRKQI